MVLVALAGPGMNVLLAVVSSLIFYGVDYMPHSVADRLARNLVNSLQINAVLCVFNLLPLPPLDGGRVAVGLLPAPLARPLARLEPYGMMILMSLFVLSYVMVRIEVGFSLLAGLIGAPTQWLIRFVLGDHRAIVMEDGFAADDFAGDAPRETPLVLALDGYDGPIDLLLARP